MLCSRALFDFSFSLLGAQAIQIDVLAMQATLTTE